MDLSYTKIETGIRIDRVKEPESLVVIPEEIQGLLVTELGSYVLAEHDVEELYLPRGVEKIGAYAFYNCEKLKRLHCFSKLRDLGTGLFAGTKGADFLDFHLVSGEGACLEELISDLRQTLRVQIHGDQEARLIFPEYFEESVENTPARILYIDTHGCGHRYRYCFQGREFQYRDYDSLFPHVQVQERESLVTELALGRVLYPCGLTRDFEEMYRDYLKKHWQMAGSLIIQANCQRGRNVSLIDRGLLPWLAEYLVAEEEQIHALIAMAQKAGDTQGVSWLMDYQHEILGQKLQMAEKRPQRRFEL